MIGPYRSMLFVPGQQPTWVPKALRARPDAIILDLEDAVAESAKAGARATLRFTPAGKLFGMAYNSQNVPHRENLTWGTRPPGASFTGRTAAQQ